MILWPPSASMLRRVPRAQAAWASILEVSRHFESVMSSVFDLLGVCLACYTAYAACSGSVVVRDKAWAKTYLRDESPGWFWSSIAIYGVLSAALIFYF